MKQIDPAQANGLKENWKRLRQENIITAFEVFDEKNGNYDRVSAVDFGKPLPDFVEQISKIGKSPGDSLSLCLGVAESGEIQIFFEITLAGAEYQYQGDKNSVNTYVDPVHNRYRPYVGVSVDYKNEVCSNWALMPYYAMSPVFFSSVEKANKKESNGGQLLLSRPERVRKFIIRGGDLEIMQHKVVEGSSIRLNFGVNYGHSLNQLVGFTPVIEITPQPLSLDVGDGEDDDPTFLDFVGACPPACQ